MGQASTTLHSTLLQWMLCATDPQNSECTAMKRYLTDLAI